MALANSITKTEGHTKVSGSVETFRDSGNYIISLEIWPTKDTGIKGNFMGKEK